MFDGLASIPLFQLARRWEEHSDLDYWQAFFERVDQSDWLCGRIEGRNNTVFRTNLEWMLKEDNFARINEGFYDTYVLAPLENSDPDVEDVSGSGAKPSTLDPIPFVGNLKPGTFNLVSEPALGVSNSGPGTVDQSVWVLPLHPRSVTLNQ